MPNAVFLKVKVSKLNSRSNAKPKMKAIMAKPMLKPNLFFIFYCLMIKSIVTPIRTAKITKVSIPFFSLVKKLFFSIIPVI